MDIDSNQPGDLFTNDGLLPEQYAIVMKARQKSPEEQLLWAIFEDAVLCMQIKGTNHKSQVLRHQAEMWIAGAQTKGFSFHQVCDYLGVNAVLVRERIYKGLIRELPTYRRPRVKQQKIASYAV